MCGTEIEVTMCCGGFQCGCQGLPTEPPVCSERCYNEFMKPKEGVYKDEVCNRDGCKGIIAEHEREGCSCHISAPCSGCCHSYEYCPECDWEPEQP